MAALPELSSVPGSGAEEMFYVVTTWVSAAGQEGAPSDYATFNTAAGEDMTVTLAGPPKNAVGWNVYVGLSPSALARQNNAPLAPGSSWIMTGALSSGAALTTGQQPAWFIVDHRVIERG